MAQVEIPWGNQFINLELPANWEIVGIMQPAAISPVDNVNEELIRSLNEPIGSGKISDLAQGVDRVTIVVDDSSRPTPVRKIFPAVLSELERAGVQRKQITIVPALGVHRGITEEELASRVGEDFIKDISWENPDCDDPEKMVYLGTTSRGTPVWINKTTATADLVISIGCIEPHIIASFGGGYKNILPGVAGRETIAHNHAINCRPDTFNNVGRDIEKNPMRLDLEEAGKMLRGKVFIVNAILDYQQQVVKIVSGDPILAHREGVRVSAELYGAKVSEPVDMVITASHPMDIDLRQGVKALANTIRAVKKGGILLTLVKADEGTGVFGLANRKLPLSKGALRILAPALLPLVPRLKLKGMGEEDRFFLYFALQAMRHARLLMYAPTIPSEVKERLPFVDFINRPEEGVILASKALPRNTRVLVFPHGGSTPFLIISNR
ncbi:uncharacterized conserved protein [Anaerolinea thermolimosa]|uniref:nickel-dependent lactate racemase n=1 Tax=Anaerolinea thermolimosa TaxID=229919 RepID=UPI000783C62D|nr:nickel-dependent lactate racemase [Anaerolinea thermolimosa]GAP06532.1 uncharacterized conserved protein [Anaerolinea thermolimosa]